MVKCFDFLNLAAFSPGRCLASLGSDQYITGVLTSDVYSRFIVMARLDKSAILLCSVKETLSSKKSKYSWGQNCVSEHSKHISAESPIVAITKE